MQISYIHLHMSYTRWIADAALAVDRAHDPDLTLIYLPHMDYSLQKYGPQDTEHVPGDLKQIDALIKDLVLYYEVCLG